MNFIQKTFLTFFLLLIGSSGVICQEESINTEMKVQNFSELVWPAKWFNDKKSAFSFTFDDGVISQYENVRPILDQYNFKGTFYIIPNFLVDSLPGIWRYGTWSMFQWMSIEGHEIGSHSLNHLHLPELEIGDTITSGTIMFELYQSQKLIQQKIPDQKCITLAYPYAEHNSLIDSLASLFYESARADGDSTNNYSLIENQFYKLSSVEVRFSEPRNTPEDDLDELQFIENWVDSSISKNKWGILLGHEVVPFDSIGGLWHPYSIEWFSELCNWMHNKSKIDDVWIETVANVTKYLKEKSSFSSEILLYNESQIKLNITDTLDDEIFNYPLTIFIKVPENWESVLFIQDQRIDTLSAFNSDSGKIVMANVIPDGGVISLYRLIIDGIVHLDLKNKDYELFQNYPNPFNPSTKIRFRVNDNHYVKLIIFDLLGREIATLVDEEKTSGVYDVEFSTQELSHYGTKTEKLASGIYIYSLRLDGTIINKKMILAK